MADTLSQWLPSEKELTVPVEINVSMPTMKAASLYMNMACEDDCKEFMLCRSEMEDPRKCLKEGAAVTACGVRFLQKVKKHCRPEIEAFARCIDHSHTFQYITKCRPEQRLMDECASKKLHLDRPKLGYYNRLHVHNTDRPQPESRYRDYHAEAKKVLDELPPDYPVRKEFKDFAEAAHDYFNM